MARSTAVTEINARTYARLRASYQPHTVIRKRWRCQHHEAQAHARGRGRRRQRWHQCALRRQPVGRWGRFRQRLQYGVLQWRLPPPRCAAPASRRASGRQASSEPALRHACNANSEEATLAMARRTPATASPPVGCPLGKSSNPLDQTSRDGRSPVASAAASSP